MNAVDASQMREVIENLLRAWEDCCDNMGHVNLGYILGIKHITDTELVERAFYQGPGEAELPEWTSFDPEIMANERFERNRRDYPPEGKNPLYELIGKTYKLNDADKQHLRFMLSDMISDAKKQVSREEVIKTLKEIVNGIK